MSTNFVEVLKVIDSKQIDSLCINPLFGVYGKTTKFTYILVIFSVSVKKGNNYVFKKGHRLNCIMVSDLVRNMTPVLTHRRKFNEGAIFRHELPVLKSRAEGA